MKTRARNLIWAVLLLAGLTAVKPATTPGPLQALGAGTLAAQTVRQTEVAQFLEARRAINAEEFARAAELFKKIRTEAITASPRFEADSYYWEAFARYRLGELPEARLLLETLMIGFDEAQPGDGMHRETGRLYHDARTLEFEIRGQLASTGDAGDAEALLREAEATLDASSGMPGFRVMPMEVAGNIVSLPVAIADLRGHADTAVSEAHAQADTVAAEAHAQADALTAEAHGRADSEQAPPDSLGQTSVEPVAPVYGRNLAAYQQQLADYQRQADQVLRYEWQLAEYQEAARAAAQEQAACPDASVQLAALEALMRFEINRVQELDKVLRRMDECSRKLHERAVYLVGREETRQAEQVLLELIRTYPSDDIRRDAIDELWRFNSWNVFQMLRQLVGRSNDPDTQERAILALRRSSYAPGNDSAAIRTVLISAAARESNGTEVREEAIDALARRAEVAGEHLIQLYASLDSDDLKVSLQNALERKVRINGDEESAAWAYALAFGREESSEVRAEAFGAWAAAPSVTVAYLADLYGELSEPFLKRQTIYAIYQRAGSSPDASAALMDIIASEPDPVVRERGIYWLGRTGSEEAVEFLLEVLGTTPPDTASNRPGGPV